MYFYSCERAIEIHRKIFVCVYTTLDLAADTHVCQSMITPFSAVFDRTAENWLNQSGLFMFGFRLKFNGIYFKPLSSNSINCHSRTQFRTFLSLSIRFGGVRVTFNFYDFASYLFLVALENSCFRHLSGIFARNFSHSAYFKRVDLFVDFASFIKNSWCSLFVV